MQPSHWGDAEHHFSQIKCMRCYSISTWNLNTHCMHWKQSSSLTSGVQLPIFQSGLKVKQVGLWSSITDNIIWIADLRHLSPSCKSGFQTWYTLACTSNVIRHWHINSHRQHLQRPSSGWGVNSWMWHAADQETSDFYPENSSSLPKKNSHLSSDIQSDQSMHTPTSALNARALSTVGCENARLDASLTWFRASVAASFSRSSAITRLFSASSCSRGIAFSTSGEMYSHSLYVRPASSELFVCSDPHTRWPVLVRYAERRAGCLLCVCVVTSVVMPACLSNLWWGPAKTSSAVVITGCETVLQYFRSISVLYRPGEFYVGTWQAIAMCQEAHDSCCQASQVSKSCVRVRVHAKTQFMETSFCTCTTGRHTTYHDSCTPDVSSHNLYALRQRGSSITGDKTSRPERTQHLLDIQLVLTMVLMSISSLMTGASCAATSA